MKLITYIIFILFIPFFVYSQQIPIDTLVYNDGCIKKFRFKKDFVYSGYPVEVSYSKCNENTNRKGERISDTVFHHIENTRILFTRQYFQNGIISIKDYHGSKNILLPNSLSFICRNLICEDLIIMFYLTQDSLVKGVNAGLLDTIPFRLKKTLVFQVYNSGISFEEPLILQLGEWGSMEAEFQEKCFLKKVSFWWQDEKNRYARQLFFIENNDINNILEFQEKKDSSR